MSENLFCNQEDLINEADVEQIFVRRFIEYLGYEDRQIRPKDSLSRLVVGHMREDRANYKPDFAIKPNSRVRWIIEAKSPSENLDQHIWQPRSYCSVLNGEYTQDNPVEYFLLTNGFQTRLYRWDINDPLFTINLQDFIDGNSNFDEIVTILSPEAFSSLIVVNTQVSLHLLEKCPIEDINAAFAWCHQQIYNKDNISQAAAFTEFVKVVFLKLLSDRRIRNEYPSIIVEQSVEVPAVAVRFSKQWIGLQDTTNPLATIQFREFINEMEREIKAGTRKRIFDQNETINLSPETIITVVEKLEHLYLFGMDADLNGRLFETFLNATMRGKDLGQYFTPRSIVKLGTQLTRLRVRNPEADGGWHTDILLDACCGTGGFLIEALSNMWMKVNRNQSLDEVAKANLRRTIANDHILGIDVAREPPLARIARLNMYLHGDGGSRIYQADALDKQLLERETDSAELRNEKVELRGLFNNGNFADVVLTNPPFAKTYESETDTERRILTQYDISLKDGGDRRSSLKSRMMFIERYHDLLKVGGIMVTIIDDGTLSGRNYKWFRNIIRDKYLVKAVISLPGDAFQRSKARVKTSFLILEKRNPSIIQDQPPVFMYGCQYVGIDDPARERTLPEDEVIREKAIEEIHIVSHEYANFLSGTGDPKYIVLAEQIEDRLDVKSSLIPINRKLDEWNEQDIQVTRLGDLVNLKEFSEEDIVDTEEFDDFVTYIRITYDGFVEEDKTIPASETSYRQLFRVHTNDIVISNIAATYGSVGVIPERLDGSVVTTEYTVLEANESHNPQVIRLLLRSPETRANMLLAATGANRTRVKWEDLRNIQIPNPSDEATKAISDLLAKATQAELQAQRARKRAEKLLESPLDLDNKDAHAILRAFKPPR